MIIDPLLINPLSATLLIAIICGVLGSLIVVRRMSFITGSIAHASLGGIGMSIFMGWPITIGAGIFTLIATLIMGHIRYHHKEREDTLIGALWAVGMAIGLVFLAKSPGYVSNITHYLFGNILLISSQDLLWLTGFVLVMLAFVRRFFPAIQAIAFDEKFAEISNLPVKAIYLTLLSFICIGIILLSQSVGIILMIALLTLPAATANHLTTTIKGMMSVSTLLALLGTLIGFAISFIFDLPTSAAIILTLFVQYLAVHLVRK